MLEEIVTPYEFLVRVEDGKVRGCHKRHLVKIVDSDTGRLVTESEGDAIPVELTEEMKSEIIRLISDD